VAFLVIIHLTQPPEEPIDNADEKVMALGYFDGVHLGHQQVIKTAVNIARSKGQKSAVMTFHPHPSVVLKKMTKRSDYLTPSEEKIKLMEELGVDLLYVVHFDLAFSQLSSQTFIDQYIIRLNVRHVVAGFDFTYGRMAKGTMETIEQESRGVFAVTVVSKLTINDQKVSTTQIRTLIFSGELKEAQVYLGRPYRMTGTVVHGDQRGGAELGFPTANVRVDDAYVIPDQGIYAVRMNVENTWINGMGYIGDRPTFYKGAASIVIEVHLFCFNQSIYGEIVQVEWYKKLREDIDFKSVDSLIEQMHKDEQNALAFFKEFQNER